MMWGRRKRTQKDLRPRAQEGMPHRHVQLHCCLLEVLGGASGGEQVGLATPSALPRCSSA
eukprot:10130114-Alexandrium_andersonii.AAC.1